MLNFVDTYAAWVKTKPNQHTLVHILIMAKYANEGISKINQYW